MSEFDIKKYLKKLRKTLENKELQSFYVMVDRNDFKPMKGYDTPKDLMKMTMEKKQYYAGKRIADISLFIHDKGIKTGEFVFSIKVVIYKIKENGKLDQNINTMTGLMVNYYPDDLENQPFKLRHVETFMRLCADDVLYIETLNGNKYKNVMKMLEKKGIDFDSYLD
jgi:hypothetical protein